MNYEWSEERLGVGSAFERLVGNIGIVVFSTAVFVFLGLLYLAVAKAEYTAEATVFLTHDSDRLRNEELIQIELDTHRSLMLADGTLTEAIALANVAVTPKEDGFVAQTVDSIRGMFSRNPLTQSPNSAQSDVDGNYLPAIRQNLALQQIERSRLLLVSYTDQNAESAVSFVNALVELYSESSNYYSDGLQDAAQTEGAAGTGAEPKRAVEPVKFASLSSVKISPSVSLVLSVSAMLGILFGVAIAVRREFSRIL